MPRSGRPAAAAALAVALTAVAAAQDVRSATALRPAEGGAVGTVLWSAWAPSGAFRAEILSVPGDRGELETSLLLVVGRADSRWERSLGETGRFCGGSSEGYQSTRFVAAELVDFAGGPDPELFVDTFVSVRGEEGSVSQYGTAACSLEGPRPSCHDYVGGERALAPRSFGDRGHVVIGDHDFAIEFL